MIVAFRHNSNVKATLNITDNGTDQVIIRLIPYADEHMTLHLQKDGTILNNHHSLNKPPSVWDDLRESTAAHLGVQSPQRHKGYIKHQPLVKLDNMNGYYMIGRRIDLNSFDPRERYTNNIDQTIDAPADAFMLEFYLSTNDNPCEATLPRCTTILGDLCFKFSK